RVLHTGRRNGCPSPSALPGRRARAVLAGGGGRHRKRRRQTAVLVGIWTADAGRLNQTKSPNQPSCAGVLIRGKSSQFAIFALPRRGSEPRPRGEFDAAAVLQSWNYDQRRADGAIQRR